ncbi:MAG: EF-hand domain-containing protein [Candidatus Poseidoniaceae archaeon]
MQGASSPLIDWINKDVKTANTVSIIMIIFAAWVGIEAISNVAGIAIPPETGMATNIDPNDTQRTNNGVIIGLGAVLGTLGLVIQSLIPRGEEEQEPERGPVFDEDLVKLTKWLCSRGTTTVQFFEWADVDNSGSIDMVEFANALRAAEIANLPPWEIEELVKLMDINSDGRINLPELDIALLNIRNALGIEFIPYVEEEKTEEEAAEDSEEETEDSVTEEESVETNTETETSEDEESVEDDSEEDTDEAADEESTGDEAEEEPATESEEEGSEEVEETEEAADEETTEEETEVEESDEESNDNEDASDESESDEAVEEAEDSEDESDGEETTEEVVKETPKKKKKF